MRPTTNTFQPGQAPKSCSLRGTNRLESHQAGLLSLSHFGTEVTRWVQKPGRWSGSFSSSGRSSRRSYGTSKTINTGSGRSLQPTAGAEGPDSLEFCGLRPLVQSHSMNGPLTALIPFSVKLRWQPLANCSCCLFFLRDRTRGTDDPAGNRFRL